MKLITLFLSGLLFCSAALGADDSNTITFAHDATWPPMESINTDQEIVGFDVDYADAIAEKMGMTAKHVNAAWDGIFTGIVVGKYDAIMSSVAITEARKKNADFSIPYMTVSNALLTGKDFMPKTVTELVSAKDKKIGVQLGTASAIYLQKHAPGIEVRTYDNIAFAIQDLNNGRIDGVLGDDYVIKHLLSKKPEFKEKFKVPLTFPQGKLGIAVKKGNKKLLFKINQAIREIQKQGIDKDLEKKWLGGE